LTPQAHLSSAHEKQQWPQRIGLALVAVILATIEANQAPLVMGFTGAAASVALLWSVRQRAKMSHSLRSAAMLRDARMTAGLLVGLWVGVYFVFTLADSGSDVAIATAIPVRFDGTTVNPELLLMHGLLSTAAVFLAISLWQSRKTSKRRRSRSHSRSRPE
jgi:hypothetical protein